MKKYTLLMIAIGATMTFNAIAQKKGLMGPAAKNYKPWKDKIEVKSVLFRERKQEMGPEAKNQKPWNQESKTFRVAFVGRKELNGPTAKNTRPERNVPGSTR